ncbi:hypothetical protein WMY93_025459 [Mugilogobius chulae]|uniref:Fibronectin type-III domain-containing protein n=1 Tax=Mugilogobius chulae TaxID=88201 RepID=A0AAW0N704_9GOBI
MFWACRCLKLWTTMVFISGASGQETTGPYLSEEAYLLLKHEPDPKCFTQTMDGPAKDFTCFFKTKDNLLMTSTTPQTSTHLQKFKFATENDECFDSMSSVLLPVLTSPPRTTKCETQVQRAKDGGFLHICSFPQSDIFTHVEIPLKVLDQRNNRVHLSQAVYVEENILPKPPSDVSLIQMENLGELKVSWQTTCGNNYRIKFSSKNMEEKIKPGKNKMSETLAGLVPGEEVTVQVSVRCSSRGHWSQWSHPARAVVPQSAEDISLKCHTKDLNSIACQWDHESKYNINDSYKLFYKAGLSEGQHLSKWTQCFSVMNWTGQCDFYGEKYNKIRVKLSSPSAPVSRTFYTEDFKLNKIIKTTAPHHLKQNVTDKLCVHWDSPLPSLSEHLQYETSYKPSAERHWMVISSEGPETGVCLKVSWSSQFKVKVRAKPHGPVYSGEWSDWSDVLTGDIPAHSRIMLLIQCSPVLLLVFAVIFILLFSKYFKKLKQYFWPPVPNLDKILQDFLTDLNQHKWDAPLTAKQIYAETTDSVVEVMSKDYDSGLEEPSDKSVSLLSSSETSYSSVGHEDSSMETELYPDYVALSRNNIILCSKENSYIYEDNKDVTAEIQLISPQSSECSLTCEDCLGVSDFLNHSYLFLESDTLDSKEKEQRGHGNIYTNMPCK